MSERKHLAAALGLLALVSAVCAQPVLADEIMLANGDRLTGKIVRKESDTIVLTTSYAGDVTIQWSEIRRITADGPVAVYFEDGSKLTGSIRPTGDGMVIVTAGALESDPTPLAKPSVPGPAHP